MKVWNRFSCLLMLCSVFLGGTSFIGAQSTTERDRISQMVSKYAQSIDAADTSLAAQVWLDSPDVSFIHPLGHEHGFDQVKQNVYKHLMGDTFSERNLSPRDISVHIFRDCAWVEFYWDFAAKFRKGGSPITTHGRETQVYWKTKEGWRLVHPLRNPTVQHAT